MPGVVNISALVLTVYLGTLAVPQTLAQRVAEESCSSAALDIGSGTQGYQAECLGAQPAQKLTAGELQSEKERLPEWCSWNEIKPGDSHELPPPPAGTDVNSGHYVVLGCGSDPNEQGRDAGQGGSAVLNTVFFVEEEVPPPDPAVLALQAYDQIAVPVPQISIGPDPEGVYVQIPTWLWVDNPGPLNASVTAGSVTVTATATLASTTWTLGEPPRNPSFTGFEPGPAVTVTCEGAGKPPPPDVDWKAEPVCGHTFRWRSLPERTGGTGKWPITATTSWAVTWQATTGQTGSTTLTATGEDAVAVGEYRILLVDDGGG